MIKLQSKLFILVVVITLSLFHFSCFLFEDENNDNSTNQADSSSKVEIIEQDIQNADMQETAYVPGDYALPKELSYLDKSDDFLVDKFYPIGWSKDGKFAYITEPADEGSGLYLFELVVFDAVNNKNVWSWKPEEREEGSLSSTWKNNYALFKKKLNEYQIEQEDNIELKKGKTSFKGNEYQIVLDTKTETDPDFGFDMIKEIKITINSPELGTKEIYQSKTDEYSMYIGAFVPGYILSPYNGRIVVLCQLEQAGYEGPPNIVFFQLIGSDLLLGFKPKTQG
ncbi:MAG: hypothetical protein L3J74_10940 [Bacteroidales bacterium]|nr:hypothetical protein [Bacteroidales bacterium]